MVVKRFALAYRHSSHEKASGKFKYVYQVVLFLFSSQGFICKGDHIRSNITNGYLSYFWSNVIQSKVRITLNGNLSPHNINPNHYP